MSIIRHQNLMAELFNYRPSGRWYGPPGTSSWVGVVATGTGFFAVPFFVASRTTFNGIGCEVTVASGAGGQARLGIYSDTGNGYPDALILDAGTVAIDVVGYKIIVINQILNAGLYWLVFLGSATCTVRGIATAAIIALLGDTNPTSLPANHYLVFPYAFGALPATYPAGASFRIVTCIFVGLRKA